MSNWVRIILYVGLIGAGAFFGLKVKEAYSLRQQRLNATVVAKETQGGGSDTVAAVTNQDLTGGTNTAAGKPGSGTVNLSKEKPLGTYGAGLFICIIGLGMLVARDVSKFVAQETLEFVFNDEGVGVMNPEYEEAEKVWATGDHLEAVRLLREYYRKYPREAHALLRIAEIYENNMHNYLAAILEYEEILKLKLPADRWGRTAIHLSKLYDKCKQPEKAEVLMQRIVDDYGQTAAAKKAREWLGIPEPTILPEGARAAIQDPDSNLPPGFSRKK